MNGFKILTTSAFVLRTGKLRGKTLGHSDSSQLYLRARDHLKSAKKRSNTSILDRCLEDERYRGQFQSEDITEEQVKEWDRIASGPTRENVATGAQREHWENTYYLKQDQQVEQAPWPPHQTSRLAISKRVASRACSSPRKQYPRSTTDIQQSVARWEWLARLDFFQVRHPKRGVDKHHTARMYFIAFMHCALARIPVSSSQHHLKFRC